MASCVSFASAFSDSVSGGALQEPSTRLLTAAEGQGPEHLHTLGGDVQGHVALHPAEITLEHWEMTYFPPSAASPGK